MSGFFDLVNRFNQSNANAPDVSPEDALRMYMQLQNQDHNDWMQPRNAQQVWGSELGKGMGTALANGLRTKMQGFLDKKAGVAPVDPQDDPMATVVGSPQTVAADILEIANRDGPAAAEKHIQALMSIKTGRTPQGTPVQVSQSEVDTMLQGVMMARKAMKEAFPKEGAGKDPYGEIQWVTDPANSNQQLGVIQQAGTNKYVPAMGPDGKQLTKSAISKTQDMTPKQTGQFETPGAGDKEKDLLRTSTAETRNFLTGISKVQGMLKEGATTGAAGQIIGGLSNIVETGRALFHAAYTKQKDGEKDSEDIYTAMAGATPDAFKDTFDRLSKSQIFGKLRQAGMQTAEIQSALVGLAYVKAKTENPDGRIANTDLEKALRQMGANLSDPMAINQILEDAKNETLDNLDSKFMASSMYETPEGKAWGEDLKNRVLGERSYPVSRWYEKGMEGKLFTRPDGSKVRKPK